MTKSAIVLSLLILVQGCAESTGPRQIPLESIYSLSGQKRLQDPTCEIQITVMQNSGPVVALTWGTDFEQMVKAPFTRLHEDAVTVQRPSDPDAQLWISVDFGRWHMGRSSQTICSMIDSVTVTPGNVIEVAYHLDTKKDGSPSRDMMSNWTWIPLGKPPWGDCTLRLIESGRVKLEREWRIIKKGDPSRHPAEKSVAFEIHDGYTVSAEFEPKESDIRWFCRDQQNFEHVFGTAAAKSEKAHLLPAGALDSKDVAIVIKRDTRTWIAHWTNCWKQCSVITGPASRRRHRRWLLP